MYDEIVKKSVQKMTNFWTLFLKTIIDMYCFIFVFIDSQLNHCSINI